MIEARADLFLAIEALVKYDVAFELQIRHFQRDRVTRQCVGSLENRSHATAGQQLIELILVQFVAYHYIAHTVRPSLTHDQIVPSAGG